MALRWKVIVVALCVIAIGVTLGFVAHASAAKYLVGAGGGTVGPAGVARVEVPAGAVPDRTEITFRTGTPGSQPSPGPAMALGDAVDITPAAGLASAYVRMPAVAEQDLPEHDGRRATRANEFIAVFNKTLEAWIPLETRFDASTGELVAAAPHFSWFRRYVVDPASSVWSTAVTGLQALGGRVVQTATAAGSELWKMVNGDQKHIDCTGQSPGLQIN